MLVIAWPRRVEDLKVEDSILMLGVEHCGSDERVKATVWSVSRQAIFTVKSC